MINATVLTHGPSMQGLSYSTLRAEFRSQRGRTHLTHQRCIRHFLQEPYTSVLVYHTMPCSPGYKQSLEYRRVFYDLVTCYKIYQNSVDLLLDNFSPNRSGHVPAEVILVSCDSNVYPIMHFEHTFSQNV